MSRGYAYIGLDNPKSSINIGAALRAVDVFGADMMAISGKRYSQSCTDTRKQFRHTPLLQVKDLYDVIPFDCVPVAVDLVEEAIPLTTYVHPERAFYVFGAEDATLGEQVISWCRDVIYVPTNGCLNLAACVNVVLYDRMVKNDSR